MPFTPTPLSDGSSKVKITENPYYESEDSIIKSTNVSDANDAIQSVTIVQCSENPYYGGI